MVASGGNPPNVTPDTSVLEVFGLVVLRRQPIDRPAFAERPSGFFR